MTTKPTWTPITIRLGDITPWTHNPRMSTKAQALRLIDSEKKFGQPQPFSVSPTENGKVELYDGHQRYSAWLTVYGENHLIYASQCNRHLTEDERKSYVVTFHAGAVGSWDWTTLSAWDTAELKGWGMDGDLLRDWNNDANNLREMMNADNPGVDYEKEWDGMPEFKQEDLSAMKSVIVHFATQADVDEFSGLVGQTVTEKTKSLWYPKKERENLKALVYQNES